MKKLNKKGFTIVELVIVIAVIAILAGVLIPTFATVVKRADESAAMQQARIGYENYLAENADKADIQKNFFIKVTKGTTPYYFQVENGQFNKENKPVPTTPGTLIYSFSDANDEKFTASETVPNNS